MNEKKTADLQADFKARVARWAKQLEVSTASVVIRPMTRKWASFSTLGRVTFDAVLLELSPELQDYVIVHELHHFHVPNHGKLWKSLMRAHLGNYEALETELKILAGQREVRRAVSR